ncbi:MAG: NBR1-Ig-like domain-containing protein [Aggregatilineales bacterium]
MKQFNRSLLLLALFVGMMWVMLPGQGMAQDDDEATLQRAVFPSYNFKFEYDASTFLVTYDGENQLKVRWRDDVPLPEGINFNPELKIDMLPSAGIETLANQLIQERVYRADGNLESVSFNGVPAYQQSVLHMHGIPITLTLVPVNGFVFVFDSGFNNADSSILESVDFDPPEVHDDLNRRCINDSAFVRDVTIPDGTFITGSMPFTKVWELENDGDCIWHSDYTFEMLWHSENWSVDRFAGMMPLVPYTEADERVQISVQMLSIPANNIDLPLQVRAQYQLHSNRGDGFGTRPYVDIIIN